MSEVRLVVRDAQRDIWGDTHGGVAQCVIAALSVEPETIGELELGMERFAAPPKGGHFRSFGRGVNDQPHDAGVVVVDLAARLLACDTTFAEPEHMGQVLYHDGRELTEVGIYYYLSEDWKIISDVESWRGLADARRRERRENPPLDARLVLYGQPMLGFVAGECLAAAGGRSANGDSKADRDLARQIHVKWMMEARGDLRGATPRDVMTARRQTIDLDMQGRANQWTMMHRPPRPLDPKSAAYRFAGFGTTEWVTYYELVRELIHRGLGLAGRMPTGADLAGGLAEVRDAWLDRPDPEFSNRVPRKLIHDERIRMPNACSGEEAVIDPDCPLCQMQADMEGPVFWFMDGCNMDDDFAFSFHRTREEFDEEERRQEEFNRRFNAESEERKRLDVRTPDGSYMDPDYAWDRTFAPGAKVASSPFIRLFAVGAGLCELTVALKGPPERRALLDRLSRDYGNLREVVQRREVEEADALIQPVVDRFCESLDAVAAAQADLEVKCTALRDRLARFTAPPAEGEEDAPPVDEDEDVPF